MKRWDLTMKPATVLRPVLNVWNAFSELGIKTVICSISREVHWTVLNFGAWSPMGNLVPEGKDLAKFTWRLQWSWWVEGSRHKEEQWPTLATFLAGPRLLGKTYKRGRNSCHVSRGGWMNFLDSEEHRPVWLFGTFCALIASVQIYGCVNVTSHYPTPV